MPIPAHYLEQPRISPTAALVRRIKNIGLDVELGRSGSTLSMRNLDPETASADEIKRAIRLVCEHADASRYTIEALVPAIFGSSVTQYEELGFRIVNQADEEDEDGAHFLLRRSPRQ